MKKGLTRIVAAAACIALAACSKAGSGGVGAPINESPGAGGAAALESTGARVNSWTHPHVLRYTTGEDITTLNPALNTQLTMNFMAQMTMAYLWKFDKNNNPYGELATSVPTQQNGGVSKDGLTITIHLRKGVKWSDGAPFDADDVVWSFGAVMNPANNITSRTGWDQVKKIDEPDKSTVIFHLSKPYSPFIVTFFSTGGANPAIMPKHLLAQYPNINNVAYNSLPVGIGPFKYKEWKRSDRVVMVPNPLYFRGTPKLQEIDFEIIPNSNTILTELQAKQLDLWYPVPPSYFAGKMQNLADFGYIRQPGYLFNHIDFNTTRPALKDVAVRQALRYATDRATIIQKVSHGFGILQDQPAPKISAYYDPNIRPIPFDLVKANQLLDRAGWKRGADGIRAKNGVKLSLDFVTNSGNPAGDQVIELIRSWWNKIGASITVKHYDSNLLFASYQDNGIIQRGKWDVVFFAWGVNSIGDFSALYACDQVPPQGQNAIQWCNQRANKAMHDLYAHYDQAQRNHDDAILFEELKNDVPTIVELGREDIFFFNRDLKNFHPNGVSAFDSMQNVDI